MLTMPAPMLRHAISTLVSFPSLQILYHKKAHRKFAITLALRSNLMSTESTTCAFSQLHYLDQLDKDINLFGMRNRSGTLITTQSSFVSHQIRLSSHL
ncbi:hypothetical protein B9Z55_014191 [Caenorhabditis nigoni]|uniref:Uncharacterized protein n=1 Tax=Caenorhabditis nigoni TaxID=1611254 RepID=A0A2G5U4W6_9PELO|nr:hypothetical protein B9Z55_014191 [Caenorhabditis nigoni]